MEAISKIFNMAISHNPFIFFSIVIAFIFFFIIAIFAIIKKSKGATGILKFAPSVLTSLGLLGTFLALTTSLVNLGTNESGNISSESLSGFVKSLESVFSFSILGIASAIIFMAIHFFIVAYRNKYIFNQRNIEKQDALQRQRKIQEVNNSTLEELKNHSYLLSGLRYIDSKTDEQNQYLKSMHDILRQEDDIQQEVFDNINTSMHKLTTVMGMIESGYDMDKLGNVVSKSVSDVLLDPLDKMAKSMEKNSSEIISDVLKDLKEEILIPIKNEIASTTVSTNKVVEALDKSQEANLKLITELGRVTVQMDSFVSSTTDMVKAMSGTVDDLKEMQKEQDESLTKFNEDLQTSLSGIQPAIEQGMKEAENSLTTAITDVTDKMNTAMTSVIQKISDDVVENLSQVLKDFNDNMDNHLGRMNDELENTGKRASHLIDGSASALKETLGEIDKTLENASSKLTEELEAFRQQYQFSLTEFFEQQNKALERTLGVQSERLQDTANQLGEQFDTMKNAQETLNDGFKETIGKSKRVYEPLLNQMATIAATLNNGQQHLSSEMREVVADIQDINKALKDLGNTLPKEFAAAFESLNKSYIDASNNNNDILQKMMNEMLTASAALLTASNSQLQDA